MRTIPGNSSASPLDAQKQLMELAQVGDQLDGNSLASLRTLLNNQLKSLTGDLDKAKTQEEIDEISALQSRLATQANALTGVSVLLLAGEAKVTADHIKSAVDSAQKVIDKVKSVKAKLAKLGAVIDFAAAVLTGNGKKIVEGAETLKAALEKAE